MAVGWVVILHCPQICPGQINIWATLFHFSRISNTLMCNMIVLFTQVVNIFVRFKLIIVLGKRKCLGDSIAPNSLFYSNLIS